MITRTFLSNGVLSKRKLVLREHNILCSNSGGKCAVCVVEASSESCEDTILQPCSNVGSKKDEDNKCCATQEAVQL